MSGSIQILFETFGYINLATYLYLLRKSVANVTADLQLIRIKLFLISFLTTILAWLCIFYGPKIGLESTLTCGVQFDSEFTYYTEFVRNWQLLLVPYLVYKSIILTHFVPGFIKKSFTYYAMQVVFYTAFFTVRTIISFVLQLFSVSLTIENDLRIEQVNTEIKNYKLLNYTLEVLALIGLISLNQTKFDALI